MGYNLTCWLCGWLNRKRMVDSMSKRIKMDLYLCTKHDQYVAKLRVICKDFKLNPSM